MEQVAGLAERRAQVKECENRLEDWRRAHDAWEAYAKALRRVVKAAEGTPVGFLPDSDEYFATFVEPEQKRLSALTLLGHVEPGIPPRVEFSDLLNTNLRVEPVKVLALFTERVDPRKYGFEEEVITSNLLEARLGECAALLERVRLRLDRELREQRGLLDAEENAGITLDALLNKWRTKTSSNSVAKFLWWLLKDNFKTVLTGLLLAALAAAMVWLRGL